MRPPPTHRATTAHLRSVYPFVSEPELGRTGPLIGHDVLGGPFRFDPWELYSAGAVTNPNVVVVGQVGRGKSTFVKTAIWRHLAFGRQAWILDPKGEYGALASACGTRPVVLAAGGRSRLNPLDVAERSDVGLAARSRVELLRSLLEASLRRQLTPEEANALEIAVRRLSERAAAPVLADLVPVLLQPDADAAADLRVSPAVLAADGRTVALELRRMIAGDLAGMFDGPTTADLDPCAPLVTIDLSATFSSVALPLVMMCSVAALQSRMAAVPSRRFLVTDEAWAVLSHPVIARWTQKTFKLSRAFGVSNIVVVHRLSDLRSTGGDGSVEQKLSEGLLADAETRVVFGQSPTEAAHTAAALGLSRAEQDLVPQLPRGTALWKVGGRSHLVDHLVGSAERSIVDTDAAMEGRRDR